MSPRFQSYSGMNHGAEGLLSVTNQRCQRKLAKLAYEAKTECTSRISSSSEYASIHSMDQYRPHIEMLTST